MRRLVAVMAAVVALMFSGVVHGLWPERRPGPEEFSDVIVRLRAVPVRIGAWEGETLPPPNRRSTGAVWMRRRYVNRTTGQVVTLLLGGGRSAAVSGQPSEIVPDAAHPPHQVRVPVSGGAAVAEFLTIARKCTDGVQRRQQHCIWGWNASGSWEGADDPAVRFAGRRRLFKLQLIEDSPASAVGSRADPCVEFLHVLLPELQRVLFSRSAAATPSS